MKGPDSVDRVTGMDKELHFFWLWPTARYADKMVLKRVSSQFRIVAIVDVAWPPDASAQSFNRIYARNLWNPWSREMSAGSGTSLMVIVEDDNPRYRLQVSAFGALAVANENMISVKQALREMASLHYDYAVHSSISQR